MTAMPAATDLRDRLAAAFAWQWDHVDETSYANVTGWWRDPGLLRDLGVALAGLFSEE